MNSLNSTKGSHRQKKTEFYETFSQTGGRGHWGCVTLFLLITSEVLSLTQAILIALQGVFLDTSL